MLIQSLIALNPKIIFQNYQIVEQIDKILIKYLPLMSNDESESVEDSSNQTIMGNMQSFIKMFNGKADITIHELTQKDSDDFFTVLNVTEAYSKPF